jgi:hypothetical protein
MKCLQLHGDPSLAAEFVSGMAESLADRTLFVVSTDPGGALSITVPSSASIAEVLGSMPPDLVMVTGEPRLAAPVVWCGRNPPDELRSLLIGTFSGTGPDIDYINIYQETFDLLPQRTKEECGRCGTDCRGLAAAILDGSRKPSDCYYSPGKVDILQDGKELKLGEFPSKVMEGTLRGLLSSLKGYREGSEVTIRLRAGS